MQLLRTTGGFSGWADDDLLDLPYSRFLQAVRIASKKEADAQRARMLEAAFIGWQSVSAVAGKDAGSFQKYARSLGVLPKPERPPEEVIAAERARAEENARKAIEAFSTP